MPRPGLIRRLLDSRDVGVVAVLGPPGYGKTTVLTQWAARDRRPFAWLSVDARCNDPVVLLSSLAVALAETVPVDEVVFERLVAPHRLEREAVVAGLAMAVSRAPHPFVLVLDDAHLLADAEGVDAVRVVLEHLPRGSQLALAGRREPVLGLPRLRGEGRVLDIGPDDLRLDVGAARDLLVEAGAGGVPARDLRDLVARTEGWPIGLYFAAIARRVSAVPPVRPDAFSGDDRLLADYIRTEFLHQLPPDRLSFLIRTSVLDELSGPLCDATLQRTGSAADLEDIESSNLLLVPLDRQRRWYRYHHLFQTLLRHELERVEGDAVPALATRASRWCEENGQFDSAVRYAQLAEDVPRVTEIVRRSGMRQFAIGRGSALRTWLSWLAARGDVDPGVAAMAALVSALSGRAVEAERWAALAAAGDLTDLQPDGSPLEAWVCTVRAIMARDPEQMRRNARRALEVAAPESQVRGSPATCRGAAELLAGAPDAADALLADAVEEGRSVGAFPAVATALALRALLAIGRGDWEAAAEFLRHGSSVVETGHLHSYPTVALNHAVQARVAMHRGELHAVRRELADADRLLPTLNRSLGFFAVLTRLELARATCSLGELTAAEELLDAARQLLTGVMDYPVLLHQVDELAETIDQLRRRGSGSVRLTPAELRLLPLLATQHSLKEVAEQQVLSVHTVKAQVTSIYRKLGVSSRSQAIDRARSLGLLPAPPAPPRRPEPDPGPAR